LKAKLTKRRVLADRSNALAKGEPIHLWDTELKGFGVSISPFTGRVSWLVQKWQGGRDQGKSSRIVIGHYPELSLEEARKEAGTIIADAYRGVDIVARKRAVRANLGKDQYTLLVDAVDRYLLVHANEGSRYWQENEARLTNKVVKPLGRKTRLGDLTKADLRALLDQCNGGKRLLFAALRHFFNWALAEDLIAVNPLVTLPTPKPYASRDRVLSDGTDGGEIRQFWNATGELEYPLRQFFRLLLLTGQRRNEVAGMRWEEVDLEKGEWTIPKHRVKNGKDHFVHLSSLSLATLETCNPIDAGYVLTSTRKGARKSCPLNTFSDAKEKLDNKLPIPPWRIHDLRRTCATGMASIGVPREITEKVLNHLSGVNSGLTGIYQRYEYLEERKQALEAWGDRLTLLLKPLDD